MSVIGKKPYVNKIISLCSPEQVNQVISLMDNLNTLTPVRVSLYEQDILISSANLGISYVNLFMEQLTAKVIKGILVYIDNDNCGFFGVASNSDIIEEFKIDPIHYTFDKIREYLTVEELRQVCGDALNGGGSVLPEVTKSGQVLVSNDDLEFEVVDEVPMANNLTGVAINNDSAYSMGPTGGFADISTGEEAYLQEIRGSSILLNQMMPDSGSFTLKPNRKYIVTYNSTSNPAIKWTYYTNSSTTLTNTSTSSSAIKYRKVFDVSLMFGSSSAIPFWSNYNETEYPANGDVPAQTSTAIQRFFRLFPHIDFSEMAYNPTGTWVHANPTKIVEVGRNLWDASTMEETGLYLLAGYRYEIYLGTNGSTIQVSFDGGQTWSNKSITLNKHRGDGRYICYLDSSSYNTNFLVKSGSYPIVYVGFVHSGNYALTAGSNGTSYQNYAKTDETIPQYEKYEFNIFGISNLKSAINIYDTKDVQRVGMIDDLSTLTWTAGSGTYSATIADIKPNTTNIRGSLYTADEISVNENGVVTIATSSSPTGSLLYELETPISTGQSAFEPIPLKSNNKWIVNDMGLEYFVESSVVTIPINQLSVYYENLKDKLVNLQIPEIETISTYPRTAPSMSGIKINGQAYKCVPFGNYTGSGEFKELCIGPAASLAADYNSSAYSTVVNGSCSAKKSVAVGNGAYIATGAEGSVSVGYVAGGSTFGKNNGQLSVSIGYQATAVGSSIAIGYNAIAFISNTICIDQEGTAASNPEYGARTHILYGPNKMFFRFETNNKNKTTFDTYESGHFLSEYITNNTLQQETGTNKFYLEWTDSNNYKTITKNVADGTETVIDKKITGMHITVRLANNVICGFDLLPYESSSAYISYAVCDSGGTVMSAYLDSDGVVIISNVSVSTTVSEVKYWLR